MGQTLQSSERGEIVGRFVDYTGQTIGQWNVISHDGFNDRGESLWTGISTCEHREKRSGTLSSFKRGVRCKQCLANEKIEELKQKYIGKKFGKLTIVKYLGHYNGMDGVYWEAKCECGSGKPVKATAYDIKNNRIKSCGCSRYEQSYIDKIRAVNLGRRKLNKIVVHENYAEIICSNGSTLVDIDFIETLKQMNVTVYIKDGYAYYHDATGQEIQLHRTIMGIGRFDSKTQMIVDHIDGKRNDNRKENLRVIDVSKNPINCKVYKNNTSGAKGVSYLARLNKWQAAINVDKKAIYLGIFDDINDAINVRLNAEEKYFGELRRD